jgi:CBS domain-containing protein/anti-sigma regulatory factor (Ser/Thr protein kinase)
VVAMNNRISLEKYADIFQDLKVSDIMTENVITLGPDRKISRAKEIMKIQQISGIPIVGKDKTVMGIISIQDIIHALEYNKVDEPLRNMMSTQVYTIHPDENITEVVEKFNSYKVHRFPVVDENDNIKGIVTRENVLHGIIEKFNNIYVHDKKRSTMLNSEYSPLTGEQLTGDQAEFHYKIDDSDISTAGSGAALLQQYLKKRKVDTDVTRKVGIVAYEAETNVVIHSKGEGDIFCFIKEDRIIVRVIDSGVGIEDLDKAMAEGFTTADEIVRGHGFGAGMGIPNMKRFSDKLVILSEKNVGTQVEVVFFLKND